MESSQEYGPLVKEDKVASVTIAKSVRQNIHSGRSVFKFLKFVDVYRELKHLLISSGKLDAIYFLNALHKIAAMFYYFFHNIVWIANMGAIYKHLIHNTLGWRDIKDTFSMLSNVTFCTKTYIKLTQVRAKMNETL